MPTLKRAIKDAIKASTLKTEADAKLIARQFLGANEPEYMETISVSPFLSKKVQTIISQKSFTHPWFVGKVVNVVYMDIWGRIWNKTKGIKKADVPTQRLSCGLTYINKLGGMMWQSKRGKSFTCEYRTNLDEINNQPNPQTFVG